MNKRIGTGMALLAALALILAMPGSSAEARGGRSAVWMGKKIFDGRTGPWLSEARLVDPKAQAEQARSAGRILAVTPETYRLVFSLGVPHPKTPLPMAEGRGTVTVTGPAGKPVTKDLVKMDGYFGADLALGTPGEYRFAIDFESSGTKGSTVFSYVVR